MSLSRLGRPPAGCHLVCVILLVGSSNAARVMATDSAIMGTVVDQAGQALLRAFVRAVDRSCAERARTFTDEIRRFRIASLASTDCRLERAERHIQLEPVG